MFGYVVINQSEMTFRNFEIYRSYYCGLCRVLKDNYGARGQMTLNYDMTFLTIFLDGLYETECVDGECRCIAHPVEKHKTRTNEFTTYSADMNIFLTYYKCLDDWNDDKNKKKRRMAKKLKDKAKAVREKYPEKCKIITDELDKLSKYEKNGEQDIDVTSGCFGRIMAELFLYKHDEWQTYLENTGFYLGKYLYILDAFCDYEEDSKKGRFNPLNKYGNDREKIGSLLNMMMAECTRSYEMLPIVEYNEILQNILYSGVWTGFDNCKSQKDEVVDKKIK